MSDTPRTDAIIPDWTHWEEYRELARQLERRVAEVEKAHAEAIDEWSRAEGELKEAQAASLSTR